MSRAYKRLIAQTLPLRDLSAVSALVSWDQETYMPEGGAAARAAQASLLSGLIHEKLTCRSFSTTLARLIDLKTGELARGLTSDQKAVVRETYRRYRRAKRLPNAHVGALALLCSQAQNVWGQARRRRDFKLFEPYLRRIVQLKRRESELLGYQGHPYDALLDEFEPGATTSQVSALVARLSPELRTLAAQAAGRGAGRQTSLMAQPPSSAEAPRLAAFCRTLVQEMGFDLSRGRVDCAEHPSTSSFHPSDVRLTLRRRSQTLLDDVFSTLHEGGHALYEQGLDPAHWGTPIADAVSIGVHESQSRLWETVIGRGRPFWRRQWPRLAKALPRLSSLGLDGFMRAIRVVKPSLIRLDADEITYNLHIVLRFELEKALLAGELDARDVPRAWNEKMEALLGLRPRHDGEGCLQDIHWASGALGYFPAYLLGNLYAAQFFAAYSRANGAWARDLERGHLLSLKRWLNAQVHRHGSRYSPAELLKRATGQALSPEPFLRHLRRRYGKS